MYRLPPTGKEFTDQQHLAGPLSTVFNLEILKLFFFFFLILKKKIEMISNPGKV